MRSKRVTAPHRLARGEGLPEVLRFMQLLWAVVHGVERASRRMVGQIGVTGPQRLVLRVVGLSPGLSAGEVAAILRVHPSTLTGVLRRLVGQRYVTRRAHPRDGRRAVLQLTRRGARVNRAGRGTIEAAIARALRASRRGDRDGASEVLGRVADELVARPPRR